MGSCSSVVVCRCQVNGKVGMWCLFPNLLLVVQAYSHVLIMEAVLQGLHIDVICVRFCVALYIAGCRSSEVKKHFHRRVRSCGRSMLCVYGSSCCVSCRCGC